MRAFRRIASRGLLALAAVSAALFFSVAGAAAATYNLAASSDTWIQQDNAGANFGTATTLNTQYSTTAKERRSLFQFDLSSIPSDEVIVSATLYLYVKNTTTNPENVHQVTASWTETGATWNNIASNYNATAAATYTPSASNVYVTSDITTLARSWMTGTANYGVMIISTVSGNAQYASREDPNAAHDPVLVVVTRKRPAISMTNSSVVVSDPFNGSTNPKRIPGAVLTRSIVVSNSNSGFTDSSTVVLVMTIPTATSLYVGNLGGAGSGPVLFTDGATASGLTYSYTSLASTTDNVAFSNNGGVSYTYTPVPNANGYDSAVTHVRVSPGGALAAAGAGNPSATFQIRLLVN